MTKKKRKIKGERKKRECTSKESKEKRGSPNGPTAMALISPAICRGIASNRVEVRNALARRREINSTRSFRAFDNDPRGRKASSVTADVSFCRKSPITGNVGIVTSYGVDDYPIQPDASSSTLRLSLLFCSLLFSSLSSSCSPQASYPLEQLACGKKVGTVSSITNWLTRVHYPRPRRYINQPDPLRLDPLLPASGHLVIISFRSSPPPPWRR